MKTTSTDLRVRRIVCCSIALFCLVCAAGALAQNKSDKSDELKQRVLALAQKASPDDYAFTRTSNNDSTSNGKSEKRVTVEKFNPTKPVEERWTLVSINGAPPSAEVLSKYQKDSAKTRVPGYYRFAGYFGTPATASKDSFGRTVFHFTALPKDTLTIMNTDVSQNAVVDALVSEANGTPFVEEVRTTYRPTTVNPGAKIETFEGSSRYRLGPEGKPLLMEQTSNMTASGMGEKGEAHSVVTYSDYRAAGSQR